MFKMFRDVLLAVDFDRTLTATDATIPQRNLEAIRYFMENGGAFTVNTGRSMPMFRAFLDQVPVNAPLLVYNGSAAYDKETGCLVNPRPIDLDPAMLIADLQTRYPLLNIEVQGVEAHYAFRKDPGWEAYCEYNNCAWKYGDIQNVERPFLKLTLNGEFRDTTVFSMCSGADWEIEMMDDAAAYVEKTYGDKVEGFRGCARIHDLHAKGCSKIRSARDLQKQLGRKILVCVGDGENDLNMLQGADYAFCPSDAVLADRFPNVCPCGDGAVADVIYEKIPEILKNQP